MICIQFGSFHIRIVQIPWKNQTTWWHRMCCWDKCSLVQIALLLPSSLISHSGRWIVAALPMEFQWNCYPPLLVQYKNIYLGTRPSLGQETAALRRDACWLSSYMAQELNGWFATTFDSIIKYKDRLPQRK